MQHRGIGFEQLAGEEVTRLQQVQQFARDLLEPVPVVAGGEVKTCAGRQAPGEVGDLDEARATAIAALTVAATNGGSALLAPRGPGPEPQLQEST